MALGDSGLNLLDSWDWIGLTESLDWIDGIGLIYLVCLGLIDCIVLGSGLVLDLIGLIVLSLMS